PLRELQQKGCCKMINTAALDKFSEFIMTCQRKNHEVNAGNYSLTSCLNSIEYLFKSASLYYKLGCEHVHEMKYMNAGLLHTAMHAIIIQLREKFKILSKFPDHYNKIHHLADQIITMGDFIAHTFNDEHTTQLLEINPDSLLNLMKEINNNIRTVYDINNNYEFLKAQRGSGLSPRKK